GVAEIDGVREARSSMAMRRTLSFIERNTKFPRTLLEANPGRYPPISVLFCFHTPKCQTN
ncbi:MAG: hypothetical protein ACO31A_04810, partial [Candidatus Nanopelagicaceae bacterium]